MRLPADRPNCPLVRTNDIRIMTQGLVEISGEQGNSGQIKRGMLVFSRSGEILGKVAALVFHSQEKQVICLILGHLPQDPGYQSFPVTWVDRIDAESVILNVATELVRSLPNWHSE